MCHCAVSLSKNTNPNLELVQPRKTRPFITKRMLIGHKESNQGNKPRYHACFNPLYLGHPKTSTFANSEDPDEL